jgi:mRNA interferase MazF
MKPSEIYNKFDIVVLPFPFSDLKTSKKRPALVISSRKEFGSDTNCSIVMMITTAKKSFWPGDVLIKDIKSAGLIKDCYIRFKFFTIDNRLILSKKGKLTDGDSNRLKKQFGKIINL